MSKAIQYFITGIDTDIGKSVATGMLARFFARPNLRVLTIKPVQTGCEGFSLDIALHRALAGIGLTLEDRAGETCPVLFHFPASPHLAAELEHTQVDLHKIEESIHLLSGKCDILLIEGAGGLLVPLTRETMTIDFARCHEWPVILVTSGRLGSLNHTLLSLEALRSRKMKLAGLVYNRALDTDRLISQDTEAWLRRELQTNWPGSRFWTLNKIDPEHPDREELTE